MQVLTPSSRVHNSSISKHPLPLKRQVKVFSKLRASVIKTRILQNRFLQKHFKRLKLNLTLRTVFLFISTFLDFMPYIWRLRKSKQLLKSLQTDIFLRNNFLERQLNFSKKILFKIKSTKSLSLQPTKLNFVPQILYNSLLLPQSVKNRYWRLPTSISPFIYESLYLLTHFIRPIFTTSDVLIRFNAFNWLQKWTSFSQLYYLVCEFPAFQLYMQTRVHEQRNEGVTHLIRFKFIGGRLNLSLADKRSRQTHFAITPGTFVRYFGRKKSIKKLQSLKTLAIRFLRKLLLILNLRNIVLQAKGTPLAFDQLLEKLYKPLPHSFKNPFNQQIIDESTSYTRKLNIVKVIFLNSKPFGFSKQKKKGRIKRKIRRKVMRSNTVVDEM